MGQQRQAITLGKPASCNDSQPTFFAWDDIQILRLIPKAYFLRIPVSNRKWLAAGRTLALSVCRKSHEIRIQPQLYGKSFCAHKNTKQRR
jgi:hypothetical protein